MDERSTKEVFEVDLALAQCGDVETDLARNFARTACYSRATGSSAPHDGFRAAARLLDEQVRRTPYRYKTRLWHGELAFLEWSEGRIAPIPDGAGSYSIRAEHIRVMTIHYSVHTRT